MASIIRGTMMSATVLSAVVSACPAIAEPRSGGLGSPMMELRQEARVHLTASASGEPKGMPEDVVQSASCVITGTAATVLAISIGGENLVNLISGGVVAPANRAALYIGLVGVVFASFCQIGQSLTPLYLYFTAPPPPDPGRAGRDAAVPRAAPVQPKMRMAHVQGVLSASVQAPPLRAPLPAQAMPRHSVIASASGVPGLARSAR